MEPRWQFFLAFAFSCPSAVSSKPWKLNAERFTSRCTCHPSNARTCQEQCHNSTILWSFWCYHFWISHLPPGEGLLQSTSIMIVCWLPAITPRVIEYSTILSYLQFPPLLNCNPNQSFQITHPYFHIFVWDMFLNIVNTISWYQSPDIVEMSFKKSRLFSGQLSDNMQKKLLKFFHHGCIVYWF